MNEINQDVSETENDVEPEETVENSNGFEIKKDDEEYAVDYEDY